MKATNLTLLTVGVLVAGFAATLFVVGRQEGAAVRGENASLREHAGPVADEIARLSAENTALSNSIARAVSAERLEEKQRADLERLRSEAGRMRVGKEDEPTAAASKDWTARVSQLKARLAERPDQGIPELALLSEKDWLDAVKTGSVESETDYRKVFGSLRTMAKEKFSADLRDALSQYVAAHKGQLPSDLAQLKPLFPQATDEAALSRYALLYTGNVSDVPPDARVIMETAPPVDDVFDTVRLLGLNATSVRNVDPDLSAALAALKDFARANDGRPPRQPSEMLPYLKRSINTAILPHFLAQIPPYATFPLQ